MYETRGVFSHKGGNQCSALLWCDESSSIYPLMTLPMQCPIIFPYFVLITRKLQEELANKVFRLY